MRNDELFSPHCPVNHAERLVLAYVLHGMTDVRKSYRPEHLLAKQHAVYEEWLADVRKVTTSFDCGFYEWLRRDCDAAFVFKPGDLVKHDGRYCVVTRRRTYGVGWTNRWRILNGMTVNEPWPHPMREVELKDPDGKVFLIDGMHESIEPADIPPEVFALACEKAKGCPMMRGGGAE